MKLPLFVARNLLQLSEGQVLPFKTIEHPIIEQMIGNGVLHRRSAGRGYVVQVRLDRLQNYLLNHFGIPNLAAYIEGLEKTDLTRSEAVRISSTSKPKKIRTFKGFLVNCYQPIECVLNNQVVVIQPDIGSFAFIYDFNCFVIPADVTVVGIENPENFRFIEKQKHLFSPIKPIFISRYPQNQSKDLINWLKTIPNNYWHFGDFDFEGLNIYWNEYKVHLQERAKFYLPNNVEFVLANHGDRDLYDGQQVKFDEKNVLEVDIIRLLKYIRQYRKGLEQEIYISI
jgi:hypothetical protein